MSGAHKITTAAILKQMKTLRDRRGVSSARIYHYVKSKAPTTTKGNMRKAVEHVVKRGIVNETENGRLRISSAACCRPSRSKCKRGGPGIMKRLMNAIKRKLCGSCRKKMKKKGCGRSPRSRRAGTRRAPCRC